MPDSPHSPDSTTISGDRRRSKKRAAWLLAASVGLASCAEEQAVRLNGFIEADPVRVAAESAGRLLSVEVDAGSEVTEGQRLFVLEARVERAAVAQAQARLDQAQAQAADLATGARPEEIAVLEASLHAAQASLRKAEDELARERELQRKGYIAEAAVVAAASRRDAAAAEVERLLAQIEAARLAARTQSRRAAAAAVDAAQSELEQRRSVLEQRVVTAPASGRVETRYYSVGEWVAPGAPVLSLLPPAAVKVRFFVPEPLLSRVEPGGRAWLACDGCGAPIEITITYVATEAEYTPPVLYNRENRATLVWMVEAKPASRSAMRLRPGQPVDVTLEPPR